MEVLMVVQNSLNAYFSILPSLGIRQYQVYFLLKRFPKGLTNLEISHKLMLPINSVTPRVLELRNKGLVKELGIKRQFSGRAASVWGVV